MSGNTLVIYHRLSDMLTSEINGLWDRDEH